MDSAKGEGSSETAKPTSSATDSTPKKKSSAASQSNANGAGAGSEQTKTTIKLKKAAASSSTNNSPSKKDDDTASITSTSSQKAKASKAESSKAAASSPATQEESTTQKCKHCGKQVEKQGFAAHSKQCMKAKKERKQQKEAQEAKAREEKEAAEGAAEATANGDKSKDSSRAGSPAPGKNGLTKKTSTTSLLGEPSSSKKNSKKRKADADAASTTTEKESIKPPPKKQKKDNKAAAAGASTDSKPKATGGKPKGPVDVEKQCGVPLPNGQLCARSLTCKSHAMGAKRAVPGRSMPYDRLLAQYQKKNQAKQQKAAMASTAPLPEDQLDKDAGPLDSDEEMDKVMAGVARARPRPLIGWSDASRAGGWGWGIPTRDKYKNMRLKECLTNAMGGSQGARLFYVPSQAARQTTAASAQASAQAQQPAGRAASVAAAAAPAGSPTIDTAASLQDAAGRQSIPPPTPHTPASAGAGAVPGSAGGLPASAGGGSGPAAGTAWEYEIGGGSATARRMSGLQRHATQQQLQQLQMQQQARERARSGSIGGLHSAGGAGSPVMTGARPSTAQSQVQVDVAG